MATKSHFSKVEKKTLDKYIYKNYGTFNAIKHVGVINNFKKHIVNIYFSTYDGSITKQHKTIVSCTIIKKFSYKDFLCTKPRSGYTM